MKVQIEEIGILNVAKEQRRKKENKLQALGDIQGMIRDHKNRMGSSNSKDKTAHLATGKSMGGLGS